MSKIKMSNEDFMATLQKMLKVIHGLNKALTSSMELNLSFSERIIFLEEEKVKK